MAACFEALTQACGHCSQARVSLFPAGSWTAVFCKHNAADGCCVLPSSLPSVLLFPNMLLPHFLACFMTSANSTLLQGLNHTLSVGSGRSCVGSKQQPSVREDTDPSLPSARCAAGVIRLYRVPHLNTGKVSVSLGNTRQTTLKRKQRLLPARTGAWTGSGFRGQNKIMSANVREPPCDWSNMWSGCGCL